MCRTSARILIGLVVLAVPLAAQQRLPDVRLSYLAADTNLPAVAAAWKDLLAEHPDLRGRVELTLLTESLFDEVDPRSFVDADALVLSVHDQHTIERFDATHGIDLIGQAVRRGTVFGVGEGLLGRDHYEPLGVTWDRRARAYWEYSGFANQLELLKYVLSAAGVDGLAPGEPQPNLEAGYYYPGEPRGRAFATWQEFDDWRAGAGRKRPGAPRIAVGFYGADFDSGNTGLVDAVVAEIERQGAEAVPVFGYPAGLAFETLLLDDGGEARVDVAMAFLFRFAGPDAGSSLARLDVPVLSLISLYGRGEQEWRESEMGLSLFEGTFQVVSPELAGLVAPTVVGSQEQIADPDTGLTIVARRPIPSRVAMAVRRALRYAALATTPNAGKRLALLYYNYPPGKADIGASYLNVAESLANVLERLRQEGYGLGGGEIDLSADALLEKMLAGARNVGSYAPGELDRMLDGGDAVRIGMDAYRRWLDALAPELRAKMVADWGPPEAAEVMAAGPRIRGVERELVVPVIRFGNVALLPQPARGWGEDLTQLYHADDLAPHHQYAAAYLWLRAPEDGGGFGADAVVHVGTHGTLEWLDGKAMGLSAADAPDALLGDLPDLYIYNVDVVGEGLVARRRGMATVVDHMVPPFVRSRLLPELAALGEVVDDYHQNVHKNETLAEAYADQIRERSEALGILKDLQLELGDSGVIEHEALHEIEDYMTDLRSEHIPYGLHAFGRLPEPEMRRSTVEAVVAVDRSLLPDAASVLAADMEQRIVESAPRELDNLVRGLGGGYVPPGGGGEPIRKPDAYPTGKNLYGIDPDKVPKPAAWDLGVKLADEMLASHVDEHGRYPEKVSFVIWGAETLRHEGVIESQVFHLLGTRPVWNARGDVVDVEVIPSRRLGRPRVDVVISSAAEGMFSNVTRLIDQAVQRVKALDEAENYVRRHYLATRAALVERGYSEEEADRRAGVRIFDEPPGRFNLNTSRIAAASGSWDSDVALADEYLSKMGHGYGNGFWGEPMEDVFRLTLSGVEKVVHSSSTALYGALDNDDFFMYAGGLAAGGAEHRRREPGTRRHQHPRPGQPGDDGDRPIPGRRVPVPLRQPDLDRGHAEGGLRGGRRDARVRRVPLGLGRRRHRDRRRPDVAGVLRGLRRGQARTRDEGVLRGELAVRLPGHHGPHGRDDPQGLLGSRRRNPAPAPDRVRRQRRRTRCGLLGSHLRQSAAAALRDRAGRGPERSRTPAGGLPRRDGVGHRHGHRARGGRGRCLRRGQRTADGGRAGATRVGAAASGRGLPDGGDGERVFGGAADRGQARAVVGRCRRRPAGARAAAPVVAAAAVASGGGRGGRSRGRWSASRRPGPSAGSPARSPCSVPGSPRCRAVPSC